jgi:DNA-binding transcriptional regulator YhcF (GntR family)
MREFASITLNKESGVPVYRQLADAFCGLILKGVLPPHRKLPPIRAMAQGLHINNDTVINAYKFLENKGVVYSVVGSGTYVADISSASQNSSLESIESSDGCIPDDIFPAEAMKQFLKDKATPSVSVFGFFYKQKT